MRQKDAVHGQQVLLKTKSMKTESDIEAVQKMWRKDNQSVCMLGRTFQENNMDVVRETYTAEINVLPKMPHAKNVK